MSDHLRTTETPATFSPGRGAAQHGGPKASAVNELQGARLSTRRLRPLSVGTIIQEPVAGGASLRERLKSAFFKASNDEAHLTRMTSSSLSHRLQLSLPNSIASSGARASNKVAQMVLLPIAGALALHVASTVASHVLDSRATAAAQAEFEASFPNVGQLVPDFHDLINEDMRVLGSNARWTALDEPSGLSGGRARLTDRDGIMMVSVPAPGTSHHEQNGECAPDAMPVDAGETFACLNRLTNSPYRDALIYQAGVLHNYERAVALKAADADHSPARAGLMSAYGITAVTTEAGRRGRMIAADINAATHADVFASLALYAGGHDRVVDDLIAARMMQLSRGEVGHFTARGLEAIRDMRRSGELESASLTTFRKPLSDLTMSEMRVMADTMRPATALSPALAVMLADRFEGRGACEKVGDRLEIRGDVPAQLADKIVAAHVLRSENDRHIEALGVRPLDGPCDRFDSPRAVMGQ